MNNKSLIYRENVTYNDIEIVKRISESSGFFSTEEVDVAMELVQERLSKGTDSDYYFIFAEQDGNAVAYSCFGPIPFTVESYDLYFIAVDNNLRGMGIGKGLLNITEIAIAKQGGKRIYVETSNKEQYSSTRSFYLHCGYHQEVILKDFYAPGDDKVIYLKVI
jgi:ribosomal protein S18 acetylase RimI-like enzyme